MELLDCVIIKDRKKYQVKITKQDFKNILSNTDFYLTQKDDVSFDDGLATLYTFNFKKQYILLIWVKK